MLGDGHHPLKRRGIVPTILTLNLWVIEARRNLREFGNYAEAAENMIRDRDQELIHKGYNSRMNWQENVVMAGFIIFALVIGLAVTGIPAAPSSITWERDYGKAIERARAEKKPIVADMFTDWCALCKQMDAETFADPGVIL